MPRKLKNGAKPRKSAIWVQSYYHMVVSVCSKTMGVTGGEFVERAIDQLVETSPELEALKPVIELMKAGNESTNESD